MKMLETVSTWVKNGLKNLTFMQLNKLWLRHHIFLVSIVGTFLFFAYIIVFHIKRIYQPTYNLNTRSLLIRLIIQSCALKPFAVE